MAKTKHQAALDAFYEFSGFFELELSSWLSCGTTTPEVFWRVVQNTNLGLPVSAIEPKLIEIERSSQPAESNVWLYPIVALSAHGVAATIVSEMSDTLHRSARKFGEAIDKEFHLIDREAGRDFLGNRTSAKFMTAGERDWLAERVDELVQLAGWQPADPLELERLLLRMERERILVATIDAPPKQRPPNPHVAKVMEAIAKAGPDCVQKDIARQVLFGKTEGLTETEEKRVRSVLASIRRYRRD